MKNKYQKEHNYEKEVDCEKKKTLDYLCNHLEGGRRHEA